MEEDKQPNIAIIGAGPIGIEAALYARFLGFPVMVYEAGDVCSNVHEWGHVQLFSPFELNSSPLGVSALMAQDPNHQLPEPDQLHTGREWIDRYLQPLAHSDLVRPCIKTRSSVVSVARDTSQLDDETSRHEFPFRLLVRNRQGQEHTDTADVVIDTTGTWANPKPFGIGGMPAIGESAVYEENLLGQLPPGTILSRRIPDLSNFTADGETTFLVVGRGYSAATNVIQIQEIHQRSPGVKCIWMTRGPSNPQGPMTVQTDDPLAYRAELSRSANKAALQSANESDWLNWRPGLEISSIEFDGESSQFILVLSNEQKITAHHVLANTGFHGNYEMLSALHIHRCYVSGGPMAWAASVAGTSADCLQQKSSGPDALKTTEPNFYIIGSKSYGTDPRFLFSTGLQQIRDTFKLIAERETLDLYATLKPNMAGG